MIDKENHGLVFDNEGNLVSEKIQNQKKSGKKYRLK